MAPSRLFAPFESVTINEKVIGSDVVDEYTQILYDLNDFARDSFDASEHANTALHDTNIATLLARLTRGIDRVQTEIGVQVVLLFRQVF